MKENKPHNEQNNNETSNSSFFSEEGVLNIKQTSYKGHPVEEKRWKIIAFIKKNPLSTIYKIAKETKTNYSQAHSIIRELLFCRLVLAKKIVAENGESVDGFFLPEIKKEEDEK